MTRAERALLEVRIQSGLSSQRALVALRRQARREAQFAFVAAVLSVVGLTLLAVVVAL